MSQSKYMGGVSVPVGMEFVPFNVAPQLKVKRIYPDTQLPKYQTAGAACFDLYAHISGDEDSEFFCLRDKTYRLQPGHCASFSVGFSCEVPENFALMIYSRSGHGFEYGIRLANCTGVVDSDFRGEVRVALYNSGGNHFYVKDGDRIAQAMLIPAPQVDLIEVDELSETVRGTGGFGSTGA